MTIHVSVVVPTFKRPAMLECCLTALLAQDFPPTEYEIIIVDDAADKKTQQQVYEHAMLVQPSGYTLRYLPIKGDHHGPAIARNAGWRFARGEIIAFTDDDCLPEKGWLKAGVGAFTDGVAGVSGRLLVPLPPEPTDYEYNTAQLECGEFVTANCFYRRSVLMQVGGFDERFTAAWREDSDLFFTLLERNEHCIFISDAVVVHPVRPAHWGVSLSQQWKSMFNALLYKKHPDLYRQRIQASPPWHYYSSLVVLFIAFFSIFIHVWLLTFIALAAWLYMTGRFCLQRLRKTSWTPAHVSEMLITSALIPSLAVFWRLYGMVKFRVLFL